MARRGKDMTATTSGAGSTDWKALQEKQAVGDPAKDPWAVPSFMAETNGGGSAETVPGFDLFRAITAGFETARVAGPTTILARSDAGYFSEGTTPAPFGVSFPAPRAEKVLGVDSRAMVKDTSTIPWRCICHLEVEYDAGPVGFGTGFLIGPKAVATAAHVLVDPEKKRQALRIRVIPGRNGATAPYGYFISDFKGCKVPAPWTNGSKDKAAYDFAVIPIPNDFETEHRPRGERLGYFGLKCFTDSEAAEKGEMLFVNNAGYPYEADKPYGTIWYNAGRVRKIDKTYIEYMVDTEGGQSGSPVYFFDEGKNQRYVVAIHTTGDFVNRGLRITETVFAQLKDWAAR
jgi:glutamyl endopeptidase